jgi:hypothetical protein
MAAEAPIDQDSRGVDAVQGGHPALELGQRFLPGKSQIDRLRSSEERRIGCAHAGLRQIERRAHGFGAREKHVRKLEHRSVLARICALEARASDR